MGTKKLIVNAEGTSSGKLKAKPKRNKLWLSPAPAGQKGWQLLVTYASGSFLTGYYHNKEYAIRDARQIAKTLAAEGSPSSVYVCGKDGKIQQEWSYVDDPTKYPG